MVSLTTEEKELFAYYYHLTPKWIADEIKKSIKEGVNNKADVVREVLGSRRQIGEASPVYCVKTEYDEKFNKLSPQELSDRLNNVVGKIYDWVIKGVEVNATPS